MAIKEDNEQHGVDQGMNIILGLAVNCTGRNC